MTSFFDLLTVACFCCMVVAFFQLTRRDMRTFMQLFLAGLAFAAANQVGNAGWTIMALLVLAGAGYAVFVIRGSYAGDVR